MQRLLATTITLVVIAGVTAYILRGATSSPAVPSTNDGATSTAIAAGRRQIFLYFASSTKGQLEDCPALVPVRREINDSPTAPKEALDLLFAGPADIEKEQGLVSYLVPDARLNSLILEAGDAAVDFKTEPWPGSDDLCAPAGSRAQIERVLRQFAAVRSVLVSVNGKPDNGN